MASPRSGMGVSIVSGVSAVAVLATVDLLDTCENGNKYLIKKKLDKKIWNVTDRDETGRTGFARSMFGAQLDVVKLLFGYKVHMDVGDGDRAKNKKKKQKLEIEYMGSNQSSNNITYDDLSEPVCLGQDLKTGVENNALREKLWFKDLCCENGDKAYQDIYGNTIADCMLYWQQAGGRY